MPHSTYVRAVLFGAALAAAASVPASAQTNASGDIILHAQRASVISGAWSLVGDASAADGFRLANPDRGQAKLTTALASPADYFELTFTPEAGRAYRLWIRGKAEANSWTNDSVFVQFSSSKNASGSAVYRIGTTSATYYSIEEGSGAGLSGWGWQDNGYGYGVLGETIYFSGATEKIRVQAREDGVSIDQIVLSPVTYATSAPGATKNDTTILPEPTGTDTGGSTPPPPTTTGGSWSSLANATASGLTLRKSGGCGTCADAGGVIAVQQLAGSSFSFTITSGQSLIVGLNSDISTNTGYGLKYAFSFSGTNTFEIRENGTYRSEGSFSASDVFKLSIEGTKVKYYRNGTLVYTSGTAVSGPLFVDASLISANAVVTVTSLGGSTTTTPTPTPDPTPTPTPTTSAMSWTSAVNATASGGTLRKTSGCGNCPDAGGISAQQFTSGSVSFTVGSGQSLVVGVGTDKSNSTSYGIGYAFTFSGSSTFEIREGGTYRTEGSFNSTDVFKVAVESSRVKYYRNGSLVYTSAGTVSTAVVVDATLISSGATVNVTDFSASGATTTPTPTPDPEPTPAPTGKTLRVLQWNLHHGGFGTDGVYDTNRVADWMVKMQPDVIMLNEIEKYTGWGNENQPEVYKNLMQQKTGKTWYYMFAQEFGDWSANGKGNMIMSTYPFSYTDRYELVNNYDRSVGLATITVNNRPITLMVTHLDPYDATLRLTQAKEVKTWAAPQPENRILTGDMNAWPDQSSIQYLNTYYNDSWTVAVQNGTATTFSGNSGETKNGRIDYIYYSKGASNLFVQSSRVYDTRDADGYTPSDHRPVLTQFEVR
jgi:endonuclease/exonuclease/phosphatase family metal-dependent hydrolase